MVGLGVPYPIGRGAKPGGQNSITTLLTIVYSVRQPRKLKFLLSLCFPLYHLYCLFSNLSPFFSNVFLYFSFSSSSLFPSSSLFFNNILNSKFSSSLFFFHNLVSTFFSILNLTIYPAEDFAFIRPRIFITLPSRGFRLH